MHPRHPALCVLWLLSASMLPECTRSAARGPKAPDSTKVTAAAGGNAQLPGALPHPAALVAQFEQAIRSLGASYKARTHHFKADGKARYTNRLALETSPYLLQHAHNPVDWFPWGDEAFERARKLNRPVLLSVGYSTCHWCHVMERESFEDVEIAAYMNEYYVAIKVDREERPDVDAVYMDAVNMLTGRGGWPMTVWLTPDRRPFMGGTYFPPKDGLRGSRKGFLTLLQELNQEYHVDPKGITARARQIASRLANYAVPRPGKEVPQSTVLHQAFQSFDKRFDESWGGFGRAPKFPRPVTFDFLLRYYRRSANPRALELVVRTLERMAAGGLYDHLGGGFHRYSTDREWLTPHFEKMLYDNAQLVVAYTEAWQITGEARFARIITETLDYLNREMSDAAGGFWSATDADSEGEEGKFFVWTPQELQEVLGEQAAALFQSHYGVTPSGNFEHRTSILHLATPLDELAQQFKRPVAELEASLAKSRKLLYERRLKRIPPLTDHKVLTGWNGLTISAYARAALALGREDYAARASKAAAFILDKMRPKGQLKRVYRGGDIKQAAFLDDYSFLIAGLLDLFEATRNVRWLKEAMGLQEELSRLFRDKTGGYFFVGSEHEALLVRQKPSYDGAVPSGNSTTVRNLLRLGEFTTQDRYRAEADAAFSALADVLARRPTSAPRLLAALDFRLDQPKEIVIVTDDAEADTKPLLDVLRRTFLPNRVFTLATRAQLKDQQDLIPWVEGKVTRKGRPTAYVCERQVCKLPTSQPAVFAKQINEVRPLPAP